MESRFEVTLINDGTTFDAAEAMQCGVDSCGADYSSGCPADDLCNIDYGGCGGNDVCTIDF
jgi:hypothetical protein